MTDNDYKCIGILKSKKTIKINDPHKGEYEVTDLRVSVSRMIKDKEQITIVPIEAWGEMSKQCENLKEGNRVDVRGYYKNKKWKNGKGEAMTKDLIVAEKITKL